MSGFIRNIKNQVTNAISFVRLQPFLRRMPNGSIVIDCGANIGVVSQLFANRGAKVYAFEPDPYAFALLKKRFTHNSRVTCINKGVWDKDTTTKLFFHEDNDQRNTAWTVSSSIVEEKVNVKNDAFVEVEIVDLVRFIGELNERVHILKIDIEGAEYELLKKLIQTNTYKNIDHIFVETHETKIPGHVEKVAELNAMITAKEIQNIRLNWL